MSRIGIKVAKSGFDAKTAEAKNLKFDSTYDSFKVFHADQLQIVLGSETLNSSSSTYTASFTHDLGYIPFFLPLAREVEYLDDLASGGDYSVNDLSEVDIPYGGYSPPSTGEIALVYVTISEIILQIYRYNSFPIDQDFGVRLASVNFTLFYNQVDRSMNLLI